MLEILITVAIVAGGVAGVFVGLVALLVTLVLVMGAAGWTLDKITSIGDKPYVPPEHQIEEAYKADIQRICDTAAYGAPIFNLVEDERES